MKSKRRARDLYLRRTYGISIQQYEKMLMWQNDRCALCERHYTEFTRNLAVDHNHKTGRVRGLLCFQCNRRRVGNLTLEWARKVYAYLKKHDGDAA